MSDIPIVNETEYDLTELILKQIERDAVEYFGESVRLIRIQYGIDRHAFNARSGELRFSFSPVDFGLTDNTVARTDFYFADDVRSIDYDEDDTIDDEDDYEEIEVDEETSRETSLEAMAEEFEDDDDDDVSRYQLLEEEFDEADEEIDFMDEYN
jgi:DnaJ-domain-containing protein 1